MPSSQPCPDGPAPAGVPRLAVRWHQVWKAMERQGLRTVVVCGRGVVGSYGALTFLTGRFPGPKGELLVLRVDEPPTLVFGSAADAAAASSTIPADFAMEVAEPRESSVNVAVRLVCSPGQSARAGTVGFVAADGQGLPLVLWTELTDSLGFQPEDFGPALARCRRQKSRWDVDAMRHAVCIGEACLENLREGFRPGMSERDGAALLAGPLVAAGGTCPLLFVSCGPFSGAGPGDRRLQEDDLVSATVEFAAADGSWVELGALFRAGDPEPKALRIAEDLIAVQRSAEAALRTGRTFDSVARGVLTEIAGRGWAPVEGLGHGTGIDEEAVQLVPGEAEPLSERDLIALHPSLSTRNGLLAVSLANVVEATALGGRPLSLYPHELRPLG